MATNDEAEARQAKILEWAQGREEFTSQEAAEALELPARGMGLMLKPLVENRDLTVRDTKGGRKVYSVIKHLTTEEMRAIMEKPFVADLTAEMTKRVEQNRDLLADNEATRERIDKEDAEIRGENERIEAALAVLK